MTIQPGRCNLLGVLVDATDYRRAVEQIMAAAHERRPLAVTALAVHGVMTAVHDPSFAARLSSFDLVTPDGQPVRWGLNLLDGAGLDERVYGPTLAAEVLGRCAAEGLPVFLYGTTDDTLDRLAAALREQHPGLEIAGREPSRFREGDLAEVASVAERMAHSGARVVLVGLGCPRQEVFAHALRSRLDAPVLAVGAAFDYHAGNLRPPPSWMQARGLEWLWRLMLEPRRLWRRYVLLNPAYLVRLGAQKLRLWRPAPVPPEREPAGSIPL